MAGSVCPDWLCRLEMNRSAASNDYDYVHLVTRDRRSDLGAAVQPCPPLTTDSLVAPTRVKSRRGTLHELKQPGVWALARVAGRRAPGQTESLLFTLFRQWAERRPLQVAVATTPRPWRTDQTRRRLEFADGFLTRDDGDKWRRNYT